MIWRYALLKMHARKAEEQYQYGDINNPADSWPKPVVPANLLIATKEQNFYNMMENRTYVQLKDLALRQKCNARNQKNRRKSVINLLVTAEDQNENKSI